MDYQVSKIYSRKNIQFIASAIRKKFNIETIKLPVVKLLDLLDATYDNLSYCIIEDSCFDSEVMSYLEFSNNKYQIVIRESVYNGAVLDDGASRGFICHELSHYILIALIGAGPTMIKGKPKEINNIDKLPCYCSMEWQAKALCGELMIPYEICKNLTFDEVKNITCSSYLQTEYFMKNIANK